MRPNLRISSLLLESKASQRRQSSLRSGLTCHGFRMRHIYLRGPECVPETTRVQERKRAARREEAIITSKLH